MIVPTATGSVRFPDLELCRNRFEPKVQTKLDLPIVNNDPSIEVHAFAEVPDPPSTKLPALSGSWNPPDHTYRRISQSGLARRPLLWRINFASLLEGVSLACEAYAY
jgi:hypothetical protein